LHSYSKKKINHRDTEDTEKRFLEGEEKNF